MPAFRTPTERSPPIPTPKAPPPPKRPDSPPKEPASPPDEPGSPDSPASPLGEPGSPNEPGSPLEEPDPPLGEETDHLVCHAYRPARRPRPPRRMAAAAKEMAG